MSAFDRLTEIFSMNSDKRICVLGTTCCGKSTLQAQFPHAVDMDEVLWPRLSPEEERFICQKPWTSEIGAFTARLVHERVHIEPGHPLFSLIVLDCDAFVYLDISDELLRAHCVKRGAEFSDARNVKTAIENSLTRYMATHGDAKLYRVDMTD